jgi:phosphatidylserine synthase
MFIRARAFAVHVFTVAGAALALAALIYAVRGQWPAMFLCLGIALIVDGVDGSIARWLKVAEVLPRWSGDVLDLVVDFVTYVFVPAYAIAAGGLLPQPLALPAGKSGATSACSTTRSKSTPCTASATSRCRLRSGRSSTRRRRLPPDLGERQARRGHRSLL